MTTDRFSWRARARSFKYAFSGIATLFRTQHNAWLHAAAAVCVVAAACVWHVSTAEWCVLILCMAGVLMAEAFNSAVEFLADKVSPGRDPLIKCAKDLAAGAVLLFVIGAVAAGLIIFIPKIFG